MSLEDIMNLTVSQFNSRIKDIWEIHKMFNDGGKGRTKRDTSRMKEVMRGKGIKPPATIAG